MLPNTEQYVNHSKAHWVPLEYMGKLTNGMNINEYVRLNPDISLPDCACAKAPLIETSQSDCSVSAASLAP